VNSPGGNTRPVPASGITNFRFSYSQSNQVINVNPDTQLFMQRMRYGQDLSAGWYVHEWQYGNGLPELPSSRDFVNTSELTDMEVGITHNQTVTSPAFLRVISDQLVPVIR
jgi:hypothetical protein